MGKKKKPFLKKLLDDLLGVICPENIIPFVKPKDKCGYCVVKVAKWKHEIVDDYACDDCVPRGCSCHIYEKRKRKSFSVDNYEYKKDKCGRELPCEEWIKIHHQ